MKSMSGGIAVEGSPLSRSARNPRTHPKACTLPCCFCYFLTKLVPPVNTTSAARISALHFPPADLGAPVELRKLIHAVVNHAAVGEMSSDHAESIGE